MNRNALFLHRPARAARPTCAARVEGLERRMLLAAGSLDPSFSTDGRTSLAFSGGAFVTTDVAALGDGRTVVAGTHTGKAAVARLTADGAVDASFGNGGIAYHPKMKSASGVAIDAAGRFAIAGGRNGDGNFAVGWFTPAGVPEGAFVSYDDGLFFSDYRGATDIAVQADGKLVVVGTVLYDHLTRQDDDFMVVRINANGTLDTSFDGDGLKRLDFGGTDVARAVTLDYSGTPSTNPRYGTIVVVGDRRNFGHKFAVARLRPNGDTDNSFDGNGLLTTSFPGFQDSIAYGVTVQPTGKIVVVGRVGPDATTGMDMALARYNVNGTLDTTFGGSGTGLRRVNLGGDDQARDVIAAADGGLLVGGMNGSSFAIVAFNVDGVINNTFGTGGKVITQGTGGSVARLARASLKRFVAAGGPTVARYLEGGNVIVGIATLDALAREAPALPDGSANPDALASFFVYRNERAPVPTRVFLGVGGTARPLGGVSPDYTGVPVGPTYPPPYVDIPAFETYAVVTIRARDDALPETDETARFAVLANAAYEIGSPNVVTIDIIDNDRISLNAVADAYVRDGASAGTNFGAAPELIVKNQSGYNRETYLRFNISGLNAASINNVRLRLYGRLSDATMQNVGVSVFGAANTTWAESGITWTGRPATSGAALSTTTILSDAPQWYEWDVTAYVKAQRTAGATFVTLVLKAPKTSGPYAVFNSDEATWDRPQLAVF